MNSPIRLDTCRHHYRFLSSLYNRIHLYTSTIQEENSFHRERGLIFGGSDLAKTTFGLPLSAWVSGSVTDTVHRKSPLKYPTLDDLDLRHLLIRFLVLNFTNTSWFRIDHLMCFDGFESIME